MRLPTYTHTHFAFNLISKPRVKDACVGDTRTDLYMDPFRNEYTPYHINLGRGLLWVTSFPKVYMSMVKGWGLIHGDAAQWTTKNFRVETGWGVGGVGLHCRWGCFAIILGVGTGDLYPRMLYLKHAHTIPHTHTHTHTRTLTQFPSRPSQMYSPREHGILLQPNICIPCLMIAAQNC